MRKLFTLFTLSALLFAACDNGGGEVDTKPSIKLNSEKVIEIAAEGGEAEIFYTVANGADTTVNVSESAAWIDTEAKESSILVKVKANDGVAEREAKITLKYYQTSVSVTVKQAGKGAGEYDVDFKAKRFEGIYFGTDYSTVPNFYVILSDIGAASDGSPKANGTYYFFDFYRNGKVDADFPILPNGNYSYDMGNSYGDLTFSEEGSWYAVMDAQGKYAKSGSFSVGTVTVTDGKFEAVLELTNGEKHHVVFEGLLQTTIGHVVSTFTDDVELAVDGATISAKFYGDSYSVGYQNWFIEAKKGNDLYMVEVFNSSNTSPDGLYQMLPTDSKDYANKFIPGMFAEGGLVGSWYAKLTDNTIKGEAWAPMRDGIIRISTEGETLTIEYGCQDDAGNNITGSVKGKVTISDESGN